MATVMDDEIGRQFARITAIWPLLRSRQDVRDEVQRSVHRHREKITQADIVSGFDALVESTPTIGFPPGPHEIVGCILRVAAIRSREQSAAEGEHERTAPGLPRTEVVGRSCRQCGGELILLPEESTLWCAQCNSVIVQQHEPHPRFAMTYTERLDVSTRHVDGDGGAASVQDARDAIKRIKTSVPAVPGYTIDADEFGWDDAA